MPKCCARKASWKKMQRSVKSISSRLEKQPRRTVVILRFTAKSLVTPKPVTPTVSLVVVYAFNANRVWQGGVPPKDDS